MLSVGTGRIELPFFVYQTKALTIRRRAVSGPGRNRTFFRSFGGSVASYAQTRGGTGGGRTHYLSHAMRTLSQMSYGPKLAPRMGFDPISTRLDKPPSTASGLTWHTNFRVTGGNRTRLGESHNLVSIHWTSATIVFASPAGFEPATLALGKPCTSTVLRRH